VNFLAKLQDAAIHLGMPAVTAYHLLCTNVFLNTAAQDAEGLEWLGNAVLAPYRYVFVGQQVRSVDTEWRYEIVQSFDYHEDLFLKTAGAMISLPLSVTLGSLLKGAAFFSAQTRARHEAIEAAVHATYIESKREAYQNIGIDLGEGGHCECLGYERRPGDEQHLVAEKTALIAIIDLLQKNQILFWADCGTCLGAYRYGGVIPWDNDYDLAILEPDFCNMKRALSALDPALYLVEDWSNRLLPNTYVRVYVRATRQYIDIYTYAIHPERRTVQYICSNLHNMFMREGWKINESRYTAETPFNVVFPLSTAAFDGLEIPVPYQTEKYLQMRYGENLTPAKVYNSQTNNYEKDLSHPYWQRAFAH
jgi:hypothetical protein